MPSRPPKHRPPFWKPQLQAERDRKAAFDRTRGSAAERGYDKDWFRLRHHFLKANPVCCCGCGQPATEVDHIKSVHERPDLRLVWSNLRAMAKACHSQRTARDQGFARKRMV